MAILAAIALAALLLEDDYFFALHEGCEHLAYHLGSVEHGGAYLYGVVIGLSEENAVKLYSVSFFSCIAEIVNIQELLRLCLELLSLDFYNCVHLLMIVLQVIPSGEAWSLATSGTAYRARSG